jgi:hypothetical protein
MVTWPRRGTLLEWLLCAANWGLRAGGEGRDYAHFALQELATLGQRAQAEALTRRLERSAPRDVVQHVMECTAIAEAHLLLDDEPAAIATFDVLEPRAAKQQRKSDAAFLRGAVAAFRAEHGLLPEAERAALPPPEQVRGEHALARAALRHGKTRLAQGHARAAARVARAAGWGPTVVALLLEVKAPQEARALWLALSKEDRDDTDVETLIALGLRARALPLVKARAEAAMGRLVPSEWNVHLVVANLVTAIDELTRLRHPKLAQTLLTVTLERFATGQFDGRGFSSAGACTSLARVVFRQQGWPAAAPWLDRALAVKGTPRRQTLPDVIEAALEMKRFDDARRWAEELPPAQRAPTLAELHFRARQRKELAVALRQVKPPLAAARLSWGFVRRLTGRA